MNGTYKIKNISNHIKTKNMEAKIELKKIDLYQYGEKYEVYIELISGYKFSAKLEEHDYNRIKQNFNHIERTGRFGENEIYS